MSTMEQQGNDKIEQAYSSSNLGVRETEHMGKGYFAVTKINGGSMVLRAVPLAVVSTESWLKHVCAYCLAHSDRRRMPVACAYSQGGCKSVVYCSPECQRKHCESFHSREVCQSLTSLRNKFNNRLKQYEQQQRQKCKKQVKGMMEEVVEGTEKRNVGGFEDHKGYLLTLARLVMELVSVFEQQATEHTSQQDGWSESPWNSGPALNACVDLCANTDMFNSEDLGHFHLVSEIVLESLSCSTSDWMNKELLSLPTSSSPHNNIIRDGHTNLKSTRMQDNGTDERSNALPSESSNAQRQKTRFLVTLLCQIECNAFGYRDKTGDVYAFGLHPPAAYFNHSCAPNIAKYNEGRDIIFRTAEDIEEGQECLISYAPVSFHVEARREHLKGYFFKCHCRRCLSNLLEVQESVSRSERNVEKEEGAITFREDVFRRRFVCDNCDIGMLYPLATKPHSNASSGSQADLPAKALCRCTICWREAPRAS